MKEADIRLEFQKLIRGMGFWDYHPPDETPAVTDRQIEDLIAIFNLQHIPNAFKRIREVLKPPEWRRESITISRPDIYGLHPLERTVVIECKAIAPKVNIEPYLDPSAISEGQRTWLDAWKYQAGGLCYLGLGTIEGSPRRAFLIPWDVYVILEKKEAEKAINFKMPISMFTRFELVWVKGAKGCPWKLPEDHPLELLSTPETSPNQVDWKKQISLRFVKKGE